MRDRFTLFITIRYRLVYILLGLIVIIIGFLSWSISKPKKDIQKLQHGDLTIIDGEPRKVIELDKLHRDIDNWIHIWTILPNKNILENRWDVWFVPYTNENHPNGYNIIKQIEFYKLDNSKHSYYIESYCQNNLYYISNIHNGNIDYYYINHKESKKDNYDYQKNFTLKDKKFVEIFRTAEAIVMGWMQGGKKINEDNIVPSIEVIKAQKRMKGRRFGIANR